MRSLPTPSLVAITQFFVPFFQIHPSTRKSGMHIDMRLESGKCEGLHESSENTLLLHFGTPSIVMRIMTEAVQA
jgi:hypothetical protein